MCIPDRTTMIRALNDRLRRFGIGGTIVITPGIQALGDDQIAELMVVIAQFDTFSSANDPYGEHDCAAVDIHGRRVLWKIDYYDRNLEFASPDPANPSLTKRLMTVMLAEEY